MENIFLNKMYGHNLIYILFLDNVKYHSFVNIYQICMWIFCLNVHFSYILSFDIDKYSRILVFTANVFNSSENRLREVMWLFFLSWYLKICSLFNLPICLPTYLSIYTYILGNKFHILCSQMLKSVITVEQWAKLTTWTYHLITCHYTVYWELRIGNLLMVWELRYHGFILNIRIYVTNIFYL